MKIVWKVLPPPRPCTPGPGTLVNFHKIILFGTSRSLFLTARLNRIILGGGLMLAPHLLSRIHVEFVRQMNGYLGMDYPIAEDLICTPALGDDAGLIGAILLGGDAEH